jgi:hypothetical protein
MKALKVPLEELKIASNLPIFIQPIITAVPFSKTERGGFIGGGFGSGGGFGGGGAGAR